MIQVLFRFPGQNKANLMVCEEAIPFSVSGKIYPGFITSEFDSKKSGISFYKMISLKSGTPEELVSILNLKHTKCNISLNTKYPGKKHYFDTAKNALTFIHEDKLKKVVLSRKQDFGNISVKELQCLFSKLCINYFESFVYLMNIPGKGIWCGATPEKLLTFKNGFASSIALAATRKIGNSTDSSILWNEKEREEQQLVEYFIEEVLKKHEINNYVKSGPFTSLTGSLAHIATDFYFNTAIESALNVAVELHPTPALSGYPQQEAIQFILKHEGYDRELYGGFLGPIFSTQEFGLFVNIRCMKVTETGYEIFAGGGYTKDSNPDEEYLETEIKVNAIKRYI